MSMPAALDRPFTRDEVLAFPDDGNRYELVYGELLVSPSPVLTHQLVVGRLHAWLFEYCRRTAYGRVFFSPADISWGRDDTTVQPDVFVVKTEQRLEHDWRKLRHFALFIECLSPSTTRQDRFTKRRLYQDMQVPVYWIVDLAARRIEVWTPSATMPAYEGERVTWQPEGASEAFTVELGELFAP